MRKKRRIAGSSPNPDARWTGMRVYRITETLVVDLDQVGPFSLVGDGREDGLLQVHEIARAVRAASRMVPGATCLTQALAGQILLSRAGYDSELRIGVCRHAEHGFEAHAWLEHRGEILLGELGDLSRFTPMAPLQGHLGGPRPR